MMIIIKGNKFIQNEQDITCEKNTDFPNNAQ